MRRRKRSIFLGMLLIVISCAPSPTDMQKGQPNYNKSQTQYATGSQSDDAGVVASTVSPTPPMQYGHQPFIADEPESAVETTVASLPMVDGSSEKSAEINAAETATESADTSEEFTQLPQAIVATPAVMSQSPTEPIRPAVNQSKKIARHNLERYIIDHGISTEIRFAANRHAPLEPEMLNWFLAVQIVPKDKPLEVEVEKISPYTGYSRYLNVSSQFSSLSARSLAPLTASGQPVSHDLDYPPNQALPRLFVKHYKTDYARRPDLKLAKHLQGSPHGEFHPGDHVDMVGFLVRKKGNSWDDFEYIELFRTPLVLQ